MKSKPSNLERKKFVRIIYWAIIIIVFMAIVFFSRNSFLKVILKHREASQLQEKVNILQTENEILRKENQELKTNPDAIEKIAREKLGYQKSDEQVFKFLNPNEENASSTKDK